MTWAARSVETQLVPSSIKQLKAKKKQLYERLKVLKLSTLPLISSLSDWKSGNHKLNSEAQKDSLRKGEKSSKSHFVFYQAS